VKPITLSWTTFEGRRIAAGFSSISEAQTYQRGVMIVSKTPPTAWLLEEKPFTHREIFHEIL
jgi:hypothetical protein